MSKRFELEWTLNGSIMKARGAFKESMFTHKDYWEATIMAYPLTGQFEVTTPGVDPQIYNDLELAGQIVGQRYRIWLDRKEAELKRKGKGR